MLHKKCHQHVFFLTYSVTAVYNKSFTTIINYSMIDEEMQLYVLLFDFVCVLKKLGEKVVTCGVCMWH